MHSLRFSVAFHYLKYVIKYILGPLTGLNFCLRLGWQNKIKIQVGERDSFKKIYIICLLYLRQWDSHQACQSAPFMPHLPPPTPPPPSTTLAFVDNSYRPNESVSFASSHSWLSTYEREWFTSFSLETVDKENHLLCNEITRNRPSGGKLLAQERSAFH